MAVQTSQRLPHYPALDGLRGVAILAVFLTHALTLSSVTGPVAMLKGVTDLGWLGVDLFFVLSGFLITAILLRTPATRRGLKNFFFRRALRTWPLYYACLAIAFLVFPFVPLFTSADLHHAIRNQLYYWLHASNIYFYVEHTWSTERLNHFWSLAVEEQFYLLWPLVVIPFRGRLVPLAALVLIPLAVWLRVHLFHLHAGHIRMRVLLPENADALIFGALVALVAQRCGERKFRPLAGVVLLASAAYTGYGLFRDGYANEPFKAYLLPAVIPGFAALLYLLLAPPRFLALPFSRGPLPFLGRYAYGLYVLHIFLRPLFELPGTQQDWSARLGPNAGSLVYTAIFLTLSLATAVACYHVYEKRWLRLKSRFP